MVYVDGKKTKTIKNYINKHTTKQLDVPDGTRTRDFCLIRATLCQLSY